MTDKVFYAFVDVHLHLVNKKRYTFSIGLNFACMICDIKQTILLIKYQNIRKATSDTLMDLFKGTYVICWNNNFYKQNVC